MVFTIITCHLFVLWYGERIKITCGHGRDMSAIDSVCYRSFSMVSIAVHIWLVRIVVISVGSSGLDLLESTKIDNNIVCLYNMILITS